MSDLPPPIAASLLRLPDGSWISPDYIKMVEAVDVTDLTDCGCGYHAARVILHIGWGHHSDRRVYETADFEAACELRDRLGNAIEYRMEIEKRSKE